MGTALRLSLFLWSALLVLCVGVGAEEPFPALKATHPPSFGAYIHLQPRQDGYEAKIVSSPDFPAQQLIPLHRISEVLISLALLEQIQLGKASLDDPVNYHLPGQRVLEPFGEISLRHLLTRSHGLPYRTGGLFVTQADKALDLKQLLELDLRPPVMPPDTSVIDQSMGELLQGAVLGALSGKPVTEAVQRFVQDSFKIQLEPLEQSQLPPSFDRNGQRIPPFLPATPALHGYGLKLPALAQLLSQLHQNYRGSQWRMALLSGYSGHQEIHYLESDWLGVRQKIAFAPAQDSAFYYVYNQDVSAPGEAIQQTLLHSADTNSADTNSAETASGDLRESFDSGAYALLGRDSHTLQKALNLFEAAHFQWDNDALQFKFQDEKRSYRPHRSHWDALDASGRLQIKGEQIRELSGAQRSWQRISGWRSFSFQALWAGVLLLIFAWTLIRATVFLIQYEPQLQDFLEEDQGADSAGPPPDAANASESLPESSSQDSERAGWGLPLLQALGSVAGMSFILCIGPALTRWGRIGSHYAWAVRDQLPSALIFCLILPLLGLVLSLILMALSSLEWKTRPWQKGEKLHLGLYLGAVLIWLLWVGQWNLLGFRF